MALIKCKECGNEVSDTAKTCPKCGAKVPKGNGIGIWTISGLVVVLLFSLMFLIALLSGGTTTGSSGSSSHSVTYYVDSSNYRVRSASLTYKNGQGGTQQEEVLLPWKKSFSMQHGDFVHISAQNQQSTGNITVRIDVDGKEFKRSEASGGYTIASAGGSCCR